jgi:hypothetical protein
MRDETYKNKEEIRHYFGAPLQRQHAKEQSTVVPVFTSQTNRLPQFWHRAG